MSWDLQLEVTKGLHWWGCLLATLVVTAYPVHGQPMTEPTSAAKEIAAPAPIPLADISSESETALAFTRDLRSDLSADHSAETVAQQLPAISREIDGRLRESRKIVAQLPSIEVLRGLEGEWNRLRHELAELNRDLTGRLNELQRYLAQLDDLVKTWDQTLAAPKMPTRRRKW